MSGDRRKMTEFRGAIIDSESLTRMLDISLSTPFMELQIPFMEILRHILTPVTSAPFPLRKWRRGYRRSFRNPLMLLKRARQRVFKAYNLVSSGLHDEAGEEAWRAAHDAINALSIHLWGYEIRSHAGFAKVVDELAKNKILDITVEYGNATSLHSNFFDPILGEETVKANITQVERLISKIEAFIFSINPAWLQQNLINMISKLFVQLPLIPIAPAGSHSDYGRNRPGYFV